MAGIVAHLAIAHKIIQILPDGVFPDLGLFYAGSIAPDGVHARENYERAHKKRSHMRDNIPDRDFLLDDNRDIFHDKLEKYIAEFLSEKNKYGDLHKGYLAHLLADEFFIMTVREEYVKKMAESGIMQWDRIFFHNIVNELHNVDLLIALRHSDTENIKQLLSNTTGYEITGYVSEDELNRSRGWVIQKFFSGEKPSITDECITYERMLKFINEASAYIINYFKKHYLV